MWLQHCPELALPDKQQRMQERGSALAIRMRLSPKPSQVLPQLVIETFDVMCMRLANRVLLSFDDGLIRPMRIRAVMNMFVRRQLRLKHFCRFRSSITKRKAYDLVTRSVYCPPQPDGLFF